MGPRQLEVFAESVHKQSVGRKIQAHGFAVDFELQLHQLSPEGLARLIVEPGTV
jgi:hypothetical protein